MSSHNLLKFYYIRLAKNVNQKNRPPCINAENGIEYIADIGKSIPMPKDDAHIVNERR